MIQAEIDARSREVETLHAAGRQEAARAPAFEAVVFAAYQSKPFA